MVYSLIGISDKYTAKKRYFFKDGMGVEVSFTSKVIKDKIKNGDVFTGVKVDSIGRLIESEVTKPLKSTSSVVYQYVKPNINRGFKISLGDGLRVMAVDTARGKRERYVVNEILSILENYEPGRVCVVTGLRRTGKTTAILQTINNMVSRKKIPIEKIAYVAVDVTADNGESFDFTIVDEVMRFIDESTCEYIFIDEATHLAGILNQLKGVADYYSRLKKIILSGTYSYLWPIAAKDVLYGRMMAVDMTYMSFKEYCDVFPLRVQGYSSQGMVDQFTRFSGVISETEYSNVTQVYQSLQTAVVDNILSTLKRNPNNATTREYAKIILLADKEDVTKGIYYILLRTCQTQNGDVFKAGSVKIPEVVARLVGMHAGDKADELKKDIRASLSAALIELNVIHMVRNIKFKDSDIKPQSDFEFVCHVNSLYSTVVGEIDSDKDLSGASFENLVLSQCVQWANRRNRTKKYLWGLDEVEINYCRYSVSGRFANESNKTPEVDIVVTHKISNEIVKRVVVEVKTEKTPNLSSVRNFFIPSMAAALGKVDRYIVVYKGNTVKERQVNYINSYEFLMDIGKHVL